MGHNLCNSGSVSCQLEAHPICPGYRPPFLFYFPAQSLCRGQLYCPAVCKMWSRTRSFSTTWEPVTHADHCARRAAGSAQQSVFWQALRWSERKLRWPQTQTWEPDCKQDLGGHTATTQPATELSWIEKGCDFNFQSLSSLTTLLQTYIIFNKA